MIGIEESDMYQQSHINYVHLVHFLFHAKKIVLASYVNHMFNCPLKEKWGSTGFYLNICVNDTRGKDSKPIQVVYRVHYNTVLVVQTIPYIFTPDILYDHFLHLAGRWHPSCWNGRGIVVDTKKENAKRTNQ